VFISSAFFSSIAVKECSKAKIPCISIIDTNVKSYGINLAIPGNDDNLDCVLFYN
jgi:ribosomal protein S2